MMIRGFATINLKKKIEKKYVTIYQQQLLSFVPASQQVK